MPLTTRSSRTTTTLQTRPSLPLFSSTPGSGAGKRSRLNGVTLIFENRICRINKNFTLVKSRDKNWSAGKRQKLVSETKTPAGVREIPLNDRAVEMLEQIQNYNRKRGIETPYVISTDSGAQISERSLFQSLEYAWEPLRSIISDCMDFATHLLLLCSVRAWISPL